MRASVDPRAPGRVGRGEGGGGAVTPVCPAAPSERSLRSALLPGGAPRSCWSPKACAERSCYGKGLFLLGGREAEPERAAAGARGKAGGRAGEVEPRET